MKQEITHFTGCYKKRNFIIQSDGIITKSMSLFQRIYNKKFNKRKYISKRHCLRQITNMIIGNSIV